MWNVNGKNVGILPARVSAKIRLHWLFSFVDLLVPVREKPFYERIKNTQREMFFNRLTFLKTDWQVRQQKGSLLSPTRCVQVWPLTSHMSSCVLLQLVNTGSISAAFFRCPFHMCLMESIQQYRHCNDCLFLCCMFINKTKSKFLSLQWLNIELWTLSQWG